MTKLHLTHTLRKSIDKEFEMTLSSAQFCVRICGMRQAVPARKKIQLSLISADVMKIKAYKGRIRSLVRLRTTQQNK